MILNIIKRLLWQSPVKFICMLSSLLEAVIIRPVHITRARQACARRETHLDFTCARKSSSTLLQLLARRTPLCTDNKRSLTNQWLVRRVLLVS
jgi:hypothetical protein